MERMTLTVGEMADCLGIGRNAAYDLVKEDSFPSLKIGRQIRIPKKSFELWLTEAAEKDKNVSGF